MESIFPDTHEKCNEKSWNLENVTKLISCSIHLDLKYMEEEKQDNGYLSRMYDSLEGNDIDKAMEDQIAELKTEEDSSENGLLKDFGIQMSYIISLIQASTQKETDNSDIETIYS